MQTGAAGYEIRRFAAASGGWRGQPLQTSPGYFRTENDDQIALAGAAALWAQ